MHGLVKAHALLGDADALDAAQENVEDDDDEDATLAKVGREVRGR